METAVEDKSLATILIADDEENIQKLFARLLGSEYKLVTAFDGEEAVEQAGRENINLALVDIKMPGLNGLEVTRKIKAINETTEVIMITGDPRLETVREAVKGGVFDYLAKPFENIENIRATIEKALDKQRLNALNKELLANLKKKVFELETLYQVSEKISYNLDYEEIFKVAIDSLSQVVDFEVCLVFVALGKANKLVSRLTRPVSRKFVQDLKEIIGKEVAKLPLRNGNRPVLDIQLAGEKIDQNDSSGIGSFLSLPIYIQGRVVGFFHISSSQENTFGASISKLINTLVNQISIAVERLRNVVADEKNKMETVLDGMSEGVVMWDENEELIICNPRARRMLQLNKNELSWNEIKQRLSAVEWGKLNSGNEANQRIIKEVSFGEPEESILHLEISSVRSIEGKNYGMVMVIRDITKEREIDRMKTEFISNVSHELRTPLTSLREIVSQQLDGVLGEINPQQRNFLQVALKDLDRLSRMIDELLDVSRIEAGKLELKKQLVNLKTLAEEILVSFQPLAKSKQITLKEFYSSEQINLYLDKDRIAQVITNLIGNALKFTPENGVITLEIQGNDKSVEVAVSDTGIGIAAEDLSKLFERFQQANRDGLTKNKGSGLGLYISKQIVESHHGKFRVESELDKGSKFIFSLPKKIGRSILVVDDEKDIVNTIVQGLKLAGYETLVAFNGKAAIALAREKIPNLIILDMKMPDVTGYEVIGRLKEDLATCNIPIVVMSGYSINEEVMEKLKATAIPSLKKPFTVEQLLDKVYRYIRD